MKFIILIMLVILFCNPVCIHIGYVRNSLAVVVFIITSTSKNRPGPDMMENIRATRGFVGSAMPKTMLHRASRSTSCALPHIS